MFVLRFSFSAKSLMYFPLANALIGEEVHLFDMFMSIFTMELLVEVLRDTLLIFNRHQGGEWGKLQRSEVKGNKKILRNVIFITALAVKSSPVESGII